MPSKPHDLEARTEAFAAAVRQFVRSLPRTVGNIEDVRQLVRSSGSIAANCIEANESLGVRDRIMRFRIARKEAKESGLWLRLVNSADNQSLEDKRSLLLQEAIELKLLLTAIVKKLEGGAGIGE